MKTHLSMLVFLAQATGFKDLLFEELEPLIDVAELVDLPSGVKIDHLSGYSLVVKGELRTPTDLALEIGDVVVHVDPTESTEDDDYLTIEDVTLLHFPTSSMETLLRREPEIGMLLLEQLRRSDKANRALDS